MCSYSCVFRLLLVAVLCLSARVIRAVSEGPGRAKKTGKRRKLVFDRFDFDFWWNSMVRRAAKGFSRRISNLEM